VKGKGKGEAKELPTSLTLPLPTLGGDYPQKSAAKIEGKGQKKGGKKGGGGGKGTTRKGEAADCIF